MNPIVPEEVDPHQTNELDLEWHSLLMEHIHNTCNGRYCIFCCVERIPL